MEEESLNSSDEEASTGKVTTMQTEMDLESTGIENNKCLKCKQKPLAYECMPCRCPAYCSSCAMKVSKYK